MIENDDDMEDFILETYRREDGDVVNPLYHPQAERPVVLYDKEKFEAVNHHDMDLHHIYEEEKEPTEKE